MKRKAFSLLEMSIIVTILALLLSVLLPFIKANLEITKIQTENKNLKKIENSLIAHMVLRGNLPKADSDGDGVGDISGLGDLPYIDLNLQPFDKYGMIYKYDPADSIVNSDTSIICTRLSQLYEEIFDINNSTVYPQMVDELNNTQNIAAAVVISRGVDKILTGINNSGYRKYDMEINSYDLNSRNDIVLELNPLEMIKEICEDTTGGSEEEPVVRPPFTIVAIGDVHYNSDIDSQCRPLLNNQNISTNAQEVLTFYKSNDPTCIDLPKTVSMTYAEMDAMDVDPNDNIINVIKEENNGKAPTMSDN